MPIAADRLRGLEQVFHLRQVGVRIAVVDQRIQILTGLPDGLLAARQAEVFLLLAQDVRDGLLLVVDPIELRHPGIRLLVVLAKLFLRFAFLIAPFKKFVPVFETFHGGCGLVCRRHFGSPLGAIGYF